MKSSVILTKTEEIGTGFSTISFKIYCTLISPLETIFSKLHFWLMTINFLMSPQNNNRGVTSDLTCIDITSTNKQTPAGWAHRTGDIFAHMAQGVASPLSYHGAPPGHHNKVGDLWSWPGGVSTGGGGFPPLLASSHPQQLSTCHQTPLEVQDGKDFLRENITKGLLLIRRRCGFWRHSFFWWDKLGEGAVVKSLRTWGGKESEKKIGWKKVE